jgi:phospholipase/carboxylesterase
MILNYLIQEPKTKREKYPLLLLLHGYGSNEADLFSFARELPSDAYIISAQAPHTLMNDAYAWYAINFTADQNKFSDIGQARQSREMILRFIEELQDEYPIDTNDITLIGFSQGAILSYAIALSYPEKIRRVVALSGYLNTEIAVDDFVENTFTNTQFFISHGSMDQVIPVEWAQKAPHILNKLGIKNTYQEYPTGHGVAPKNFFDFKAWLEETASN